MSIIDIIAYFAAICTTISFVPQVIKIIKEKETKDISLIMYILFLAGLLLWTIYGILQNSFPIIIANTVTFCLAMIILIYKIKYK